MRHALQAEPVTAVPEGHVWLNGDILDQGSEGACVGFSWTAWENAKPRGFQEQQDNAYAQGWYKAAQARDPWPGDDYDGTTVAAGAKVAIARSALDRYLWAGSKSEIDMWILTKGPVVVGSDWFKSMDSVGRLGWVKVDPSSGVRGGHAYLLLGRTSARNYVFQNSWGVEYADEGLFYMNEENFNMLVTRGNAEFCTALQTSAVA
jgi:hypothetical protein